MRENDNASSATCVSSSALIYHVIISNSVRRDVYNDDIEMGTWQTDGLSRNMRSLPIYCQVVSGFCISIYHVTIMWKDWYHIGIEETCQVIYLFLLIFRINILIENLVVNSISAFIIFYLNIYILLWFLVNTKIPFQNYEGPKESWERETIYPNTKPTHKIKNSQKRNSFWNFLRTVTNIELYQISKK